MTGNPAGHANNQQIKFGTGEFGNRTPHLLSSRIVAYRRGADNIEARRVQPVNRLQTLPFNNFSWCIHFPKSNKPYLNIGHEYLPLRGTGLRNTRHPIALGLTST
jgi:hypothetical protein